MGGTLIALLGLAAAVWVIFDVLVNQKRMSTGMKVLWVVLAIFFSLITAILYFFLVKRGKL